MRLIDADALKEELAKRTPHFAQRIEFTPCFEAIRDAPIVDAVPVVRCQDCKYYEKWDDRDEDRVCVLWDGYGMDENDFCSSGERKNDATD